MPIQETIIHYEKYIITIIYYNNYMYEKKVKNKLPKICSKLILKRLLSKLTTENTSMFTSEIYKQTNGCTIGGPLSVIFSDVYMTKT